jgi:LacI family transcriptional regulator
MRKARHESGNGSATLQEVAERAGVSAATVSRVLNSPDSVREGRRSRVLKAIRELSYVPHGPAQALVSRRTGTIGAIVPTLNNGLFAECIAALQTRLNQEGYVLLLATSEYDLDREVDEVTALLQRGIDALMLVGGNHNPEVYARVESRRIPLVLTWSLDSKDGYDCVGFDNMGAARRIAEYLLDLSHRRFGIIAGIANGNDRAAGRIAGFTQALMRRGIPIDSIPVIECPYSINEGRAAMRTLLRMKEVPTAVLCGNDILAFGALAECHTAGIAVPRQISIAGYDDSDMATCVTPPLTTVRVRPQKIGEQAAAVLLAKLRGTTARQSVDVLAEVILRQSTAPPPTD